MKTIDPPMLGASDVARAKVRTAARFKRPTKTYEQGFEKDAPGARLLSNNNICPFRGGIPILQDGKLTGAVGVSGAKQNKDRQTAPADAKAIEKIIDPQKRKQDENNISG